MPRWWNARRFDWFELLLVCAVTAAVVGLASVSVVRARYAGLPYVAYAAAQEGAQLRDRYGPTQFSRGGEEWAIRDYFQDRRDGFFVDVGANHYKNDSNTYYLETVLGWSGVAIDPQAGFAADYRTHRPKTRFFAFFVSDTSDAHVTFYEVPQNTLVASTDRGFAERDGTDATLPLRSAEAVSVPAIRLTDLLDRAGVSRIDLLSVDVELAEPKVLAGFEIQRFRPALVCIEAHPQVRQQILDYFAANRYVLVGRYLRADLVNLYFSPAGITTPPPVAAAQGPPGGSEKR
jgi:FkbM family methyltransferase